jgi:hypothetical protein
MTSRTYAEVVASQSLARVKALLNGPPLRVHLPVRSATPVQARDSFGGKRSGAAAQTPSRAGRPLTRTGSALSVPNRGDSGRSDLTRKARLAAHMAAMRSAKKQAAALKCYDHVPERTYQLSLWREES